MKRSLSDHVLDIAADCFDVQTLESLAKLRLSKKLAARVDSMAAKANEGTLSPSERSEYQAYIETSEFLALIQLRARSRIGA